MGSCTGGTGSEGTVTVGTVTVGSGRVGRGNSGRGREGTGTLGGPGLDGCSERISRFLLGEEGEVLGVVVARAPWLGFAQPGRTDTP